VRGTRLSGTFTPSPQASQLSTAPHFNASSTPLTARLSSSTGLPTLPDTDPNGNPRALALRFHYHPSNPHKHTDIIAHSTPYFPSRTGENLLAFFQALIASADSRAGKPSAINKFLGENPAAMAFVQASKPTPSSLGKEAFYSVSAFVLKSASGKETNVRYRILPALGQDHLDADEVKAKADDFLFAAIPHELPITYKLVVQVAREGDQTDDATVRWPEDREIMELGTVVLDKVVEDNQEEQRKIIFDPVPRVEGIEASADPLFDVRATAYLISGRERRAAGGLSPKELRSEKAVEVAKEAPH